jgi:hypothetical protein
MTRCKAPPPDTETPAREAAVCTAVTHAIDLDPADWYIATWRKLPPLPWPPAPDFDRRACAERITRVTVRDNVWHWERAGLPVRMSAPEARFWFEAMTRTTGTTPQLLSPWMPRQHFSLPLTANEIRTRLKKHHDLISPEAVLPLLHLLSLPELVELICDDDLAIKYAHWAPGTANRRLQVTLAAGFRKYVRPYLAEEELGSIRDSLRKPLEAFRKAPTMWLLPQHGLASSLGMLDELLALVQSWPEDKFRVLMPSPYFPSPQEVIFGLADPRQVTHHMRRLRLSLQSPDHVRGWLAHTEAGALDYVLESVLAAEKKEDAEVLTSVLCLVKSPEAAPVMLTAKLQSKAPGLARQWLDQQVGNAVAGLLPIAAGRGKQAEAATEYLREIKRRGLAAVIEEELTKAPGEQTDKLRRDVLEYVEKVYPPLDEGSTPAWLEQGVLEVRRERPGLLPDWVRPASLPPLLLGSHRLNEAQTEAVLCALRKSTLLQPHALVRAVRKHVAPHTLDAFAWALFETWLAEGAPNGHKWAFQAVGHLGGDGSALKLTPLLRVWPGQSLHQRAVAGLECLLAIGTDTALMQLNSIAQKLRYKGLQNKAREFMEAIAKARGLSRTELEDRIVPDLDLDERGTRRFDFGPRQFSVVLGPDLKPLVRDEAGKIKSDLPKPGVKDDPEKAGAAVQAWKILKKQLREVLKVQAARLEQAMVSCRRWRPPEFEKLLVRHPLMINLVRRLLWGGYDESGKLLRCFRVTEESQYADSHDDPCTLEGLATVGIVHPLHQSEEQRAEWGQLFGDYEIIAPFPQLGRRVHTLEAAEKRQKVITHFKGPKIPAMALVGILDKLGWVRGRPGDGGIVREHTKPFPGAGVTAVVVYDGVPMGYIEGWEDQHLEGAFFLAGLDAGQGWLTTKDALPLGEVDPVAVSEVLGAMAVLASKGQ